MSWNRTAHQRWFQEVGSLSLGAKLKSPEKHTDATCLYLVSLKSVIPWSRSTALPISAIRSTVGDMTSLSKPNTLDKVT